MSVHKLLLCFSAVCMQQRTRRLASASFSFCAVRALLSSARASCRSLVCFDKVANLSCQRACAALLWGVLCARGCYHCWCRLHLHSPCLCGAAQSSRSALQQSQHLQVNRPGSLHTAHLICILLRSNQSLLNVSGVLCAALQWWGEKRARVDRC